MHMFYELWLYFYGFYQTIVNYYNAYRILSTAASPLNTHKNRNTFIQRQMEYANRFFDPEQSKYGFTEPVVVLGGARLLSGEHAQSNLDKLMSYRGHYRSLGRIFEYIKDTPISNQTNFQSNFDTLIEAVPHEDFLCQLFGVLQNSVLLTDEKYAQGNFNDFIQTGIMLNYLVCLFRALKECNSDLITQANLDAYFAISSELRVSYLIRSVTTIQEYSKKLLTQTHLDLLLKLDNLHSLTCVLPLFRNTTLLTDEKNNQANCEAIIRAEKNIHDLLKELKESNFALLTQKNFDAIVKLNGDKVFQIEISIKTLREHSQNLITQTNFDLLLKLDNPFCLVILLTGEIDNTQLFRNVMKECVKQSICSAEFLELFDAHNPATQNIIFAIYKPLVEAEIFSFSILERVVRLSEAQLNSLHASFILNSNIFNLSQHPEAEPAVLAIQMKWEMATRFKQLPPAVQQDMPRAGDVESSMNDVWVKQARERFEILKEKYGKNLDLKKVETAIRRRLLEAIAAELALENKSENKKIIDFIRKNLESLSNRRSPALNQQAVNYFKSVSTPQTAWRVYEPSAPCVHWPNLLTPPSTKNANNVVFATRAASEGLTEGEVTETLASQTIREFSAVSFLAAQDNKLSETEKREVLQDHEYYLAEIHRAHNEDEHGTDSPSCFPGCFTRMSQATNKHPLFRSVAANDVDLPKIIDLKVISMIEAFYRNYCVEKNLSVDEQALLYFALIAIDLNNADEIIAKPKVVETILSAAHESEESKKRTDAETIAQAMKLRGDFFAAFDSKSIEATILNFIKTHPKTRSIEIPEEQRLYLVTRALARIRTLGISLTAEAKAALQGKTLTAIQQEQKKLDEIQAVIDLPFPVPVSIERLNLFNLNATDPANNANGSANKEKSSEVKDSKSDDVKDYKEKRILHNHHIPTYQRAVCLALMQTPEISLTVAAAIVNHIITDRVLSFKTLQEVVRDAKGAEILAALEADINKAREAELETTLDITGVTAEMIDNGLTSAREILKVPAAEVAAIRNFTPHI